MLQIQGSLVVIPQSVSMDTGTMRVSEDQPSLPAVVQTLHTLSGDVTIVFPIDTVDQVIHGLQEKKKAAKKEAQATSSDLVIPGSMQEVESFAKAVNELETEQKP